MKVAVLQSNYIPWKGYFDIIHDVDLFVFYDEVQYTKNDWRNRNKISTSRGAQWLTIPCGYNINQKICETKIKNELNWQEKHYNMIRENYIKAPHFNKYKTFLEYVYLDMKWEYLSQLNRFMIEYISKDFLGIATKFADSREFYSTGIKHDKLLSLVKSTGADYYISGPAAKGYIISEDYKEAGITIEWKDYSGYPEYAQLNTPFEHGVSILDLLLNVGEEAPYYIWGWRKV